MVTADTETLDPFPIDGLGLGLSVWLGLGLGLGVRLSTRVVHLKNDYEVELRDEPQTPPDEVAHPWLRENGLDPTQPRALNRYGEMAFHSACQQGRTDMCAWLKQKGSSDLMNVPDTGGFSPLFWSVFYNRIDTALWMIAHGADPCIITANQNATILAIACQYSSPSFVAELASRVPGHIALTDAQDLSPMHYALLGNKVSTMKLLVLLGVPIRRQDFPSSIPGFVAFDLLEPRNELRSWVEDEVRVHNVFVTLVLGCGVHHRDDKQKQKQTKRRYSTTGTNPSCQLAKLRSGALTEVRMLLAACLGVRTSAAEIRRLRYAREELRALPAHPRVRPPSPQR